MKTLLPEIVGGNRVMEPVAVPRPWSVLLALAFSLLAAVPTSRAQDIETILPLIEVDSLRVNLEYLAGVRPTPIGPDSVEVMVPGTGALRMVADTVWSMMRWHPDLPRRFIADRLRSYGYEPLVLEMPPPTWNSWARPVNVTAVLPSSSGRSEMVLVGAHYDAVYSAIQGADDNGTGTAAVLELARVLAGRDPVLPIVFAFWDDEELGLVGSRGYADEAYDRGDTFAAVVNLDMIGWSTGSPDMMVAILDDRSRWLADRVVDLAAQYTPELQPYQKIFGRSDHVGFAQRGYPAVMLIEDYDRDFNPYYHSEQDRTDRINFEYFHEMTRLAAATVVSLAWNPPGTTASETREQPSVSRFTPYPVPADDWVRFAGGPWSHETRVVLLDLLGREMVRGSDRRIDVSSLAPGVYLYRIEHGSTVESGLVPIRH